MDSQSIANVGNGPRFILHVRSVRLGLLSKRLLAIGGEDKKLLACGLRRLYKAVCMSIQVRNPGPGGYCRRSLVKILLQ